MEVGEGRTLNLSGTRVTGLSCMGDLLCLLASERLVLPGRTAGGVGVLRFVPALGGRPPIVLIVFSPAGVPW